MIAPTPAIISEALGGILVGGALLQVGLVSMENARRAFGQRRQSALSLEILQTELAMLRDLRNKRADNAPPWNGFRKFLVSNKVLECGDVCSFYLTPHDKKPLADFLPGQYLTFRLNIPGVAAPILRCYSISDGPHRETYRVTIKRVPPRDRGGPPGLISGYFHDQVETGDILDVKAPSGQFFLDPAGSKPVVLIGSGIGLTPVLAMLNTLVAQASNPEIWFFHGIRNCTEHIMKGYLENVARENPNVRLNVCCSQLDESYVQGRDYHHAGRITINLLKEVLPSSNFDFYTCGPGPMMQEITEGLKEWGVPSDSIHYETFGPSSVKKVAAVVAPGATAPTGFAVQFRKSCKTVNWRGEQGNILEFAEANGINIPSACRAGACGTCQVAVFSGEVAYVEKPDFETEPGTRLTCIGAPKSDLVLDA
jgi:ferredoxin-NADP reductase